MFGTLSIRYWETMRGVVHVCTFAVLISFVVSQDDAWEFREVDTVQGRVRGYRVNPAFNVFEYHNIPYAIAPRGIHRFKAPLPPARWGNSFFAVDRGITCPQPTLSVGVSATEDCLVANIFAPGTEQTNLPVLVIVHGGAYQVGDGSLIRTRGFVDSQKVIVVTFNYRLSVHGFLCLGTEDVPGNAGMKDQVALLRWVKDNIANFGGSPDNVTITGCGAGGSAVETLMLSKLTDGLFHRVIANSGCSTSTFGVQLDPLQNAKDHVLHRLNVDWVNVESTIALAEFYTTGSLNYLMRNLIDSKDTYFDFKPCVEKDVGQEMFLDDAPINIIKSGNYKKVPILFGYSHMGGMLRLNMFDEWKVKMNETFADFLPADLEFENEQEKEELAQKVKEFYFGNDTVSEETILSYVNYFTDVMFVTPVHRAVTLQVNANNTEVYLYDYSFVHNQSLVIPYVNEPGASHCDEVQSISDMSFRTPEFLEMSRKMRQIFLDFMNTGNPTPQGDNSSLAWLPAAANRSPHLSVGSTFQMLGVPLESRAAFWDTIYEKHYRMPIPPNPNMTVIPEPEPNAAAIHLLTKQFWIMFAMCVLAVLYGH